MMSSWDHILTIFLCLIILTIQEAESWPKGTYGLPMPKDGCPVATFEWQTGSRTQETEQGSYAMENNHLAGISEDRTNSVTQNFCMKLSYPSGDDYSWGKGQYCIFKRGQCPTGFVDGWIRWDDAAAILLGKSTIQNKSGSLPDGTYDENTEIYYCCRNDGETKKALILPTSSPFYLLKRGSDCQAVEGMTVREEWVYWFDESFTNLNSQGGMYPKMVRSKLSVITTKIYYCYYQPKGQSKTLQTTLLVIYVFAGLIAFVLLAVFIICIIQRIMSRKAKKLEQNSNANTTGATDHMLEDEAASSEPSVIYKPSARKPQKMVVDMEQKRPMPADPGPARPLYPPVEGVTMRAPSEDSPMMERNGRPDTMPPSYEEVLREDGVFDS